MTAPATDLWWCDDCQRDHQPREHAVPCAQCKIPTRQPHGTCAYCRELAAAS